MHLRQTISKVFDLTRINILTTTNNYFFLPAGYVQVVVTTKFSDITGFQPAIMKRGLICLWLLPIARCHGDTTKLNLTGFAIRQLAAVIIDKTNLANRRLYSCRIRRQVVHYAAGRGTNCKGFSHGPASRTAWLANLLFYQARQSCRRGRTCRTYAH